MSNIKTKSYLPVFTGFYTTIFDNTESLIEYFNEDLKEENYTDDEINTILDLVYNTKVYNETIEETREVISQKANDFIQNELYDLKLVECIKFENLYSPREYNFSNDSINCEYSLNATNIKNIKEYLVLNITNWKQYIKDHFTSYDGFISYYSNDVFDKDWIIDDCLEHTTKLGVIFDFICENENITDAAMYEYIMDYQTSLSYNDVMEELEDVLKEKNIKITSKIGGIK